MPKQTVGFLSVLFCCSTSFYAQLNLVPNWDMEAHDPDCPAEMYLNAVDDWYVPSGGGTTDYFNVCYPEDWNLSVPTNLHGHEDPHSGEAYIGFGTWEIGYENLFEPLRVQLSEPLESGVEYEVSCYLSLAEISSVATDKLHFHFSTSDYTVYNNDENDLVDEAQVVMTNLYEVDSVGWFFYTDSFVAEGGEQYLSIGDMRYDADIDTLWLGATNKWGIYYAYYYIDDVVVKKKDVGVYEISSAEVSIWPTLVEDGLLLVSYMESELSMRIFDPSGRLMMSVVVAPLQQATLDMRQFQSGCYLVQLQCGKRCRMEKVFKY
jgi:hypothetical protein